MFHTLETGTQSYVANFLDSKAATWNVSSCRLHRMLHNSMLLMSMPLIQKQNKTGKHIILYQRVKRSHLVLL